MAFARGPCGLTKSARQVKAIRGVGQVKLQFIGTSAALAASATVWATPAPAAAPRAVPALWKNCTHVNKRYPHGVGKVGARDKTSGTPVTTFKRSTFLYRTAMRYNRGLDRDKDGIACEKL
jgi:hypothetical protein